MNDFFLNVDAYSKANLGRERLNFTRCLPDARNYTVCLISHTYTQIGEIGCHWPLFRAKEIAEPLSAKIGQGLITGTEPRICSPSSCSVCDSSSPWEHSVQKKHKLSGHFHCTAWFSVSPKRPLFINVVCSATTALKLKKWIFTKAFKVSYGLVDNKFNFQFLL